MRWRFPHRCATHSSSVSATGGSITSWAIDRRPTSRRRSTLSRGSSAQPGLIVPVSQQLIDEYESAKAALAEAQERADRAKAALLAALGDAEEGVAEGGIRVTYYSQTRKEYVVPASTYRVLRIRTRKEK
ncbi:MAG: hypothetical protein KatS3mg038_1258 [Candidatus Kapaibacterium sp.]|nr:MAG: hypothetical protein KatS3mg038_1258 [Candidatus Kapabacteria bacterium]